MDEKEFKRRTKQFALRVIQVVEALPATKIANQIGGQFLRSGTSVGANYRASCRARSRSDMIAKLGIVEEEADESAFWMELLLESGIITEAKLNGLLKEAYEITAMTSASIKTLRDGHTQTNPKSTIYNIFMGAFRCPEIISF